MLQLKPLKKSFRLSTRIKFNKLKAETEKTRCEKMKTKYKYLAMITTMIAVLAMLLTSLAYAQVPNTVNIYAWTDKTYYNPGEKGTLTIIIRNDRTDVDLILKNITVTYPWFAYTGEKWEGNATILDIDFTLTKNGGKIYTTTVDINIPSDGRASFSGMYGGMYGSPTIQIEVAVDKSPYVYSKSVPFYVKSTPFFMSLEGMDEIVTLFTVQVVLLIICTIIIAATIFLSARRPQITWRREEVKEGE